MEITIRQEHPKNYQTTEEVVKSAFSTLAYSDNHEHYLVNRIRKSDAFIPELSIVAFSQETNWSVMFYCLRFKSLMARPRSIR